MRDVRRIGLTSKKLRATKTIAPVGSEVSSEASSEMRNKAHIWFVDAHAEGDCGNAHHAIFIDKAILVQSAYGCVHAGMIGKCVDAGYYCYPSPSAFSPAEVSP